jgi:hypothetical protein
MKFVWTYGSLVSLRWVVAHNIQFSHVVVLTCQILIIVDFQIEI